MDIIEYGGENECEMHCHCRYNIRKALGEGDEDEVFLRDFSIKNYLFNLTLLTFPPLFQGSREFIRFFFVAMFIAIVQTMCKFIGNFAGLTILKAVAFLFGLQYESILQQINLGGH